MTLMPAAPHGFADTSSVADLLRSWGWTNAPAEIVAQAEAALPLVHQNAAVVAAAVGGVDPDDAHAALDRRPANRRDVEHLLAEFESLRPLSTQINAHLLGVQCIDLAKANYYHVETEAMAPADIAKDLNANSAILVKLVDQSSSLVIVFADADDLKSYKQATGGRADASALRKAYPASPLAIADRTAVMRVLTGLRQRNADSSDAAVKVLKSGELRNDPETRLVDEVHAIAMAQDSNDIHIDVDPEGNILFRCRVKRDMVPMPIKADQEAYLRLLKFLVRQSDASTNSSAMVDPCDGRYQYVDSTGKTVNVRCSFIPSKHITVSGEAAVSIRLRLLQMSGGEVKLLSRGISKQVYQQIDHAVRPGQGLVLLVGPTNSGKSTTIAGMVTLHREIYGDTRSRLSAEDPVERHLPGMTQCEVAIARRGKDGFQVLARNFMRHDPDLIFLGEIRDSETAEYAVQFADSGHLVFSTLHAKSPEAALQRLINMLPPTKPLLKQSAIDACTLIVGQRLAQKICEHCRKPREIDDEMRDQLGFIERIRGCKIEMPKQLHEKHIGATQCPECKGTGVSGMIPLNQTLVMTDDIRAKLLQPGAPLAIIAREGVEVTFERQAIDYMEKGLVSWDALFF